MKKIIAFTVAALVACNAHPLYAEDEVIGDWTIRAIPDPITDKVSYYATTKGEGGEVSVNCIDGKRANIMVLTNEFLGSSLDGRKVEYRVDDSPAKEEYDWYYGDKIVGNYSKYFPRNIADGKNLIIRVMDFRYGSHIISVKIDGARQAIDHIYGVCGKKSPLAGK